MSLLKRVEPEPSDGARPPRKWTIPPPPPVVLDPYEGAAILEEVEGPVAGALWQRLRDVLLWATVAPEERRGLFGSPTDAWTGISVEDEAIVPLQQPLRTLDSLVANPESIALDAVAHACGEIAKWAEVGGYPATERLFAEAAAAVLPEAATWALAAGRTARRHAQYERSLEWLRRAAGLARRQQDVSSYTLARLNRGNLELQRGNHPAARRYFGGAWRAAKRFKLRRLGAFARHDLLVLGYEVFPFEEAQAHGEGALQLYGPRHERIPYLAHDIAFLWMHHGYFSAALPLFLHVLGYIVTPNERAQVMAHVARCAAAVGEYDLASRSSDYALRELKPSFHNAAASLLYVGRAAATMGNRRQAREIAARALALARTRGEKSAEGLASAFLLDLRKRGGAAEQDRAAPESVLALQARVARRLQNVPPSTADRAAVI